MLPFLTIIFMNYSILIDTGARECAQIGHKITKITANNEIFRQKTTHSTTFNRTNSIFVAVFLMILNS